MDPDANWDEQIRINERRVAKRPLPGDSARMAELKWALREWRQSGGFCPKSWSSWSNPPKMKKQKPIGHATVGSPMFFLQLARGDFKLE